MRNRFTKTIKPDNKMVASISDNKYLGNDIHTNSTFSKEFEVKCNYSSEKAAELKKARVSAPVRQAERCFEKFDSGNISVWGRSIGNVSKTHGLVCLLDKKQAKGIVKLQKLA